MPSSSIGTPTTSARQERIVRVLPGNVGPLDEHHVARVDQRFADVFDARPADPHVSTKCSAVVARLSRRLASRAEPLPQRQDPCGPPYCSAMMPSRPQDALVAGDQVLDGQ